MERDSVHSQLTFLWVDGVDDGQPRTYTMNELREISPRQVCMHACMCVCGGMYVFTRSLASPGEGCGEDEG